MNDKIDTCVVAVAVVLYDCVMHPSDWHDLYTFLKATGAIKWRIVCVLIGHHKIRTFHLSQRISLGSARINVHDPFGWVMIDTFDKTMTFYSALYSIEFEKCAPKFKKCFFSCNEKKNWFEFVWFAHAFHKIEFNSYSISNFLFCSPQVFFSVLTKNENCVKPDEMQSPKEIPSI